MVVHPYSNLEMNISLAGADHVVSYIWTTNVVASKTTFNYINKQHTNHRLHTRPVRCHRYIIKPSSPSISRLTILMMSFYRIYPIKREIKDTTDGDRPPWYLEYTYTVTEGSWKWNITTRETVSIFSLRTIHYMYQLIWWRPETFRSDDFKFIFGNSPFCSFLFIINTLSWNS
jgi:hypothetical protein